MKKKILTTILLSILSFPGFLCAQTSPKFHCQGNSNLKTQANIDTPTDCYEFFWVDRIRWDSVHHFFYTWSGNGSLLSKEQHNFNGTSFSPANLQLIDYDANDQIVQTITKNFVAGAWENGIRDSNSYDQNRNLVEGVRLTWTTTPFGSDWDTTSGIRNLYQYNTQSQLIEEVISYWNNNQWQLSHKNQYHYNNAMEYDTVTAYTYFGTWNPTNRWVDYIWHDFQTEQSNFYKFQRFSQGAWQDLGRQTCQYNGQNSECLTESYNAGVWDSLSVRFAEYDSLGNITLGEYWESNPSYHQSDGAKWTYQYDQQGRILEKILEVYDPVDGYLLATRLVCGDFFTSVRNELDEAEMFELYPNPANQELNLEFKALNKLASISIFDLNGNLRFAGKIPPGHANFQFYTGKLESGTYILRLSDGEKQQIQRLVIQH